MPELPEVETVCRGLNEILGENQDCIQSIKVGPLSLRNFPQKSDLKQVQGQTLVRVKRVAKYLLFELKDHLLLSHLGMTGSWRLLEKSRTHDHIHIQLGSGRTLVYNDPRRFGMFDVLRKESWHQDRRLAQLGRDPVLQPYLTGEELWLMTRKRQTAIKSFIMNQLYIVGVGNIYASEALFLSGIHPLKQAALLTRGECGRLAQAIVDVLLEAIELGGTTIRDFRQAGGSSGYFQNLLLVYGRSKESCLYCQTPIRSQFIVGRNSFWCPSCQKK